MTDEGDRLAGWWADEAVTDPAFASDVLPLAVELLEGAPGPLLDLGCGEGRVLRGLAGSAVPLVGVDASAELAARASATAPVVRARLPALDWLAGDVLGGAYSVLMIEHIEDLAALFGAAHRAVRSGGVMVVVANHPVFTAEGAAPITGFADGEVLWRWGSYFSSHPVPTDIGGPTVTFHHRQIGELLTVAADAGWVLETLIERPLGRETLARMPGYEGQEGFPRLAGFRWRKPLEEIGTPDP
ncbi:MAG: class I SAM-dependent methyltransferase [Acidimicrobiia bacterium]